MPTKPVLAGHDYNSGMPLEYGVQLVMNACRACTRGAGLGSIQIALQPYRFYNICTMMFEVIGSREEGYAPKVHQTCYAGSNRVVMSGEAEDGALVQEAFERSDAVDEAMRYIAPAIFSKLRTLVENSLEYILKDKDLSDCPEVKQCQLETGSLPLAFLERSSRLIALLYVARPQALITQLVVFDKNGNVVTREAESS